MIKTTMRRKVTAILRAPVPGTKALERRLGRWLVASVKFVWWSLPGVAALLAVWIVGGNFWAAQQEKEIERAWEEFAQDWPEVEMNDSALKLEELASDLGVNLGIGARYRSAVMADYLLSHPDFAIPESAPMKSERFRQELAYLDAQLAKPNDDVESLPERLQSYLTENAKALEAIRSHILNRELPQRETYPAEVILEKNYAFLLESGLVFANLQRILQLSMLDRKLRGQHQAAEDTLETSWKLNQTLLQEQILISQLVHLIVSRRQIGTMRKLEYLSPEWQQRLAEYDFRPSLFKSVESEFFSFYGFSKDLESHYSYRKFKRLLGEEVLDNEFTKRKFFIRFFFWFRPILKPYHRFSTIKSIQQSWQELAGVSNQPSLCQSGDWNRQSDVAWWNLWAWWDPLDVWDEYPIDFVSQERKVAKLLVEVELTQKILQAKARAAELGRWPETLPDLESRICPGERWIYRVSEEGTMSLSLSREPPWLAEHLEKGWYPPLEFRTNKLPARP